MSNKMFPTVAALAALTTLAACGSSTGASDTEDAPPLTLVDYGGETSEIAKEVWLDPFTAETGVEVRQDAPNDYAKVKAQVESGNITWNVMFVQPYRAIVDCGTYFEELDTSKIPTLDDLPPLIGECGLPIDNFAYILVYDHDKFGTNPPTSWADFFDTEKYPGKRGVSTAVAGGVLEAALLGDGVSPEELYPLDMDRAIAKYETIRDDIAFFETGARQMEQIESGEVAMSLAWHGRVQLVVRNGSPFRPVWNDHLRTNDTVVLIKDSSRQDEAYDLMSYMTSPEGSAAWAERTAYGAANAKAEPELDEIGQMFDANDPEHAKGAVDLDLEWWAENYEEAIDLWTQWSAQ